MSFGEQLIALLPNLRRFALTLARSPDLADDLVQVTCEKALANSTSFQPGTRLDAWLFRIMHNAWIDQVRRRRSTGQAVDIEDIVDLAGSDGRADAEASISLKETFAAIAALPEEQRSILMLVCVEELSYQETADALGIPVGTVMSRLSRARKKLAAALGINAELERSPDSAGGLV